VIKRKFKRERPFFCPFESKGEWLRLLQECFHCSAKEAENLFEYGSTEPVEVEIACRA